MDIKMPDDVKIILKELQEKGYEAFIVGGCVRDVLMGKEPKDWDITTNATPDEMKKVFRHYQLIPTGEKYGTMSLLLNKTAYELTTFRADGNYSDGRRPDKVVFSRFLSEDLRRRDFTINAMAYAENCGLRDEFGGRCDLKNRLIKCVGEPKERFNEDALRIMRALRFAVCLDFDIEKHTLQAIWDCGEKLVNVSQERKRDELVKILTNIINLKKDTPHYMRIRSMIEYIIKRIIPEFGELAQLAHNNPYHYTDIFTHTMDMLFADYPHAKEPYDDIEILLTILFHDIGKMKTRTFDEKRLTNHYYNHAAFSMEMASEIMGRLRFDNRTIARASKLIGEHDYIIKNNPKCAKKLLNKYGLELSKKLLRVQIADRGAHRHSRENEYNEWREEIMKIEELWTQIIERNEAFNISDLAINGKDLKALGIKEGKKIGEALSACLEFVIENPEKNNLSDLTAFVGSC